jgi:hypothetical protein
MSSSHFSKSGVTIIFTFGFIFKSIKEFWGVSIEKGNDIIIIAFFVTKPPKMATIIITIAIFCNKTIEKGDESCRLLFVFYNRTKEEGNNNLLSSPSSLQQNQKEERDNSLLS